MSENKIVVKNERKPCGCQMTEYSDKSVAVRPCAPCGLEHAAQGLIQVGQILSATALALKQGLEAKLLRIVPP